MSNLKIGDLVMIGGQATAEERAKNAGRFRTVVGFVPAGFTYTNSLGWKVETARDSAVLDGDMFSVGIAGPRTGEWSEAPYKAITNLIKIDPGSDEDQSLTWVEKPNSVKERT